MAALLGLLLPRPARAGLELGPFIGAHFFSSDNQLGRFLDGKPDLAPQHMALFGVRLAWQPWEHLALEGEVGFIPTYTRGYAQPFSPVLTYRADLRIDPLTGLLGGRLRPFVLAGGGAYSLFSTDSTLVRSSTQEWLDLGLGVALDLGRDLGLRAEARLLFVPSVDRATESGGAVHHEFFTEDLEVLLGVYWRFEGLDPRFYQGPGQRPGQGQGQPARPPASGRAGDDRAATAAGSGAAASPATAVRPPLAGPSESAPPPFSPGPAPSRDRDGDGTPDASDRCPAIAGPPENQGCPDKDSDGDGIVDRLDKCPAQAGTDAAQGCPDRDRDRDGLLDREDACPDQPGPRDNRGCPDLDRDGDGIVDRLDRCPEQPETRNGIADDDGCPDEIPDEVRRLTGVRRDIQFRGATAELRPESLAALDDIARTLGAHRLLRLEIGAYTDSSGAAATNLKLSQARAQAVRDHLLRKGIGGARLVAVGYGPARPIDDNRSPAGRAANRRIELRVLP